MKKRHGRRLAFFSGRDDSVQMHVETACIQHASTRDAL